MNIHKMRNAFFAIVSAVILITQSGCGGSPAAAVDTLPIGKSIAIKLSPKVSLEVVKLPNGQLFGKYEITQSQWEAVMGDNPSYFKGPDNPVELVSWDDCQVFLKKLNELPAVKKSEMTFRLPMDAEWEYACRAGATGNYCRLDNGTEITESNLDRVAWFNENSDEKTHSVGQKVPNAFGLYDMHGNVAEWCQEEYGSVDSQQKGEAWEHHRVIRGNNCDGSSRDCETSGRMSLLSSIRVPTVGFRLCADSRAD